MYCVKKHACYIGVGLMWLAAFVVAWGVLAGMWVAIEPIVLPALIEIIQALAHLL